MIEEAEVEIDGLNISYLSTTASDAKATIVFIHGFPFDKTIWRSQLESLPQGFSGVAYDIRGFGESEGGHSFFSIDLFARDLLKLIGELRINNPVLCGISMGGYIALRATEIAADQLKGLILCDTNAAADSEEGKLKRFSAIEQILNGGKPDFAESFLKNVFHQGTFSAKPEAVNLIRNIILNTSDTTICSTLLALASRTSTIEFLPEIKKPSLILRGENDKLMSEEQALQLQEKIEAAEYEVIPEAGHLPNLESPEIFNFYLSRFLFKHF